MIQPNIRLNQIELIPRYKRNIGLELTPSYSIDDVQIHVMSGLYKWYILIIKLK